MEDKDKAIELVHKMYVGFVHNLYSYKAKQCSLVAVNEILKELPMLDYHPLGSYTNPRIDYWQRVKQEIENL